MRILGPVVYDDQAKSYNFSLPVVDEFPTATNGELVILSETNTESRDAGFYTYDESITDWRLLLNLAQVQAQVKLVAQQGLTSFEFTALRGGDHVKLVQNLNVAELKFYEPKIQLKPSAVININTGAAVEIPFTIQQFTDSDHFSHSTTVNNTQITCLKAGIVRVQYALCFTLTGNNVTASIKSYITKNGTQLSETTTYAWNDNKIAAQGTNQMVVYIPVAANDVLRNLHTKRWYHYNRFNSRRNNFRLVLPTGINYACIR